jgi:hypothetical protein
VENGGQLVQKVGGCDGASWYLQGCSPCLCRLRTDELPPVSKCWTYLSHADVMGPVNHYSLLSTDVWPLILLQWLCWERNWVVDLWISQPTCCGLCCEPFLSRAVGSIQWCWWLAKVCHVRGLLEESIRLAYVDYRGRCTCHVYQIFSCMVYIDSNHHNSHIWVLLVCGSHHVDNLINFMVMLLIFYDYDLSLILVLLPLVWLSSLSHF